MSLNIKDPTAHTLAQTLAKETGETMTQAVTEAIITFAFEGGDERP